MATRNREPDVVAQISQEAHHRDESPKRPFDVVVFGATGFTGELTAAYIARSQAEGKLNGCRWAIAGRSREKLDALACVPASVPRIVADSSDRASLDEMARQTKVIASTVGPYTLYGSELVAACVANGTHYCDLTGEVLWARDMIRAHHQAAEAAGCKIVFHCGFDCIPVDIGSFMASSQLPSGPATRVLALATKANGSASGGTLASLQEITRKQREERAAGYPDDPYALAFDIVGSAAPGNNLPEHPLRVDALGTSGGQRSVKWSSEFGTVTLPYVMSMIDCRVVRRSMCLRGQATSFDEALSIGGAARMGWFAATHLPSFYKMGSQKPGEGPSESVQRDGSFSMEFFAENEQTGEQARVRVAGLGDPGYSATAVMLAESALCLALDEGLKDGGGRPLLPERYGCLTPSTAMGMQLARRLEATGRFLFSRMALSVPTPSRL